MLRFLLLLFTGDIFRERDPLSDRLRDLLFDCSLAERDLLLEADGVRFDFFFTGDLDFDLERDLDRWRDEEGLREKLLESLREELRE